MNKLGFANSPSDNPAIHPAPKAAGILATGGIPEDRETEGGMCPPCGSEVKQEVQRAGLAFTLFAEGKPNETLQIQHKITMPPSKVNRLAEQQKRNNNPVGLREIMKLV